MSRRPTWLPWQAACRIRRCLFENTGTFMWSHVTKKLKQVQFPSGGTCAGRCLLCSYNILMNGGGGTGAVGLILISLLDTHGRSYIDMSPHMYTPRGQSGEAHRNTSCAYCSADSSLVLRLRRCCLHKSAWSAGVPLNCESKCCAHGKGFSEEVQCSPVQPDLWWWRTHSRSPQGRFEMHSLEALS